jgi:hypothetical protein
MEETYDLKFGVIREDNPTLGINKGWITFSKEELQLLFDEVVNRIVASSLSAIVREKAKVMEHIPLLHTLNIV